MPVAITRYTVLLSAPSDTKEEKQTAEDTLAFINQNYGTTTGIEFRLVDWCRDSRADSGGEPQALLNKQIVEDSDFVLAIFKERFGTPTENFGSGTEEEISIVMANGGQALVYFWQPNDDFQPQDVEQFEKIQEFKKSHGAKALYKNYSNIEDLRQLILHDFGKLLFELEGGKITAKPLLSVLCSDSDGKPMENKPELVLSPITRINTDFFDERIQESFDKADGIRIPQPEMHPEEAHDESLVTSFVIPQGLADMASKMQSVSSQFSMAYDPVEIKPDQRKIVTDELELLGISTPEDLFYLGDLSNSSQLAAASYFSVGEALCGSDNEKEKYEQLKALLKDCRIRRDLRTFLESHSSKYAICPILRNTGGSPAHHVLVEIYLSDDRYLDKSSIPIPSDFFIDRVLGLDDLSDFAEMICSPKESPYYLPYESSIVLSESGVNCAPIHMPQFSGAFNERREIGKSDFEEEITYLYDKYSLINDEEHGKVIIRLLFDRVQQGTSCAFPALLFIMGSDRVDLHYRITADELANPIEADMLISMEK